MFSLFVEAIIFCIKVQCNAKHSFQRVPNRVGKLRKIQGLVGLASTIPEGWEYTAISRKVVGKMCTRQSRKVIWDMINTLFLTTVPVEPTFVAFL